MIFSDFVTVTELIYTCTYTSVFVYLNNISTFIFIIMSSVFNYICCQLNEQLLKSLNNVEH